MTRNFNPVTPMFVIVEETEDERTHARNSTGSRETSITVGYSPGMMVSCDSEKKEFSPRSSIHEVSSNTLYDTESGTSSDYPPDSGYESTVPDVPVAAKNTLIQGLRSHHVAFITLCSVFGTGLLISSSSTLQCSGPLSLFLGYALTGMLAFQVVTALADMTTYLPLPDTYCGFAQRFVDPALGFCISYTYLGTYLLFGPNQISAATLTMSYWVGSNVISPAVWIVVFMVIIALVNYCKVTKYAYLVDAFLIIKLVMYFIVAVTLVALICGAGRSHPHMGFSYWKSPGAMAAYPGLSGFGGKFVGLVVATNKSVWSFVGIETFAVPAIETVNPRRAIPKAKKILFWILFPTYLIIALLIGLSVPYNDPALAESTQKSLSGNAKASVIFVALYNASLGSMGHFVNAALLIFIFSAANTGFYLSTRILYGLSASGMAPKCFKKTTKNGVPIYAFAVVICFNFIAFINVKEKSIETYHHFVDATSLFALLNWACILFTHIRFLLAFKVQNVVYEFQRYVPDSTTSIIPSTIALVAAVLLIFTTNISVYVNYATSRLFEVNEFLAGMIAIPIFVSLYLGFKFYYKTSFVNLKEADLFFYRDIVDKRELAFLKHQSEHTNKQAHFSVVERLKNRLGTISVKC